MKRYHWLTFVLIMLIVLSTLLTWAQSAYSDSSGTLTGTPDAYEPDDPGAGDPAWIGNDESQNRNFYPDGDVDRAKFYVKAGHWYRVHTHGLGNLVDTFLEVEVSGNIHQDDDSGDEPLSSRIIFQALETTTATITITNRQAVYGDEQVYKLYAVETAAPTATPTVTPLPTKEPPPTATPPNPIINFSASPENLSQPGECATLRWSVDRASEVFLILPNGNQEGVSGQGERQVCPLETSEYQLKVNAPAGDETVRVIISVPLPTQTPTPPSSDSGSSGSGSSGSNSKPKDKATLHVTLFVDNNGNGLYDPNEGILGATIRLVSQANPSQTATQQSDSQGQAHFEKTTAGTYSILVPALSYAQALTFRGEETSVNIPLPALRLPARIP